MKVNELNNNLVNLKDFIKQNCIGQGSYGKVYKVKELKTSEIYAAKVLINELDGLSNDQLIDISRELNIISQLNHPSVLRFIGFSPTDFKKKLRPVMITEYAPNGTLEDLISQQHDKSSNIILDDTRKLIIIYGIASSMSYLHSHDIIHRDLKPANILMDKFLFPKIGDFGLSKTNHSNFESMTYQTVIGAVKGTPLYMSPEIWEKYEYSKSSDVYAFSIICYEIITNEKPFKSSLVFEIPHKLQNDYRPEFNKSIPDSYKELITSCWSKNPSDRPSFFKMVDRLRNDRRFITEKVNETEYLEYINYIDNYNISFGKSEKINCLEIFKQFAKNKEKLSSKYMDFFSIKPSIFPCKDFIQLEDNCQDILKKAGNDGEKLFLIGKYIFESEEIFPRNPQMAIKYLKESMKTGFIQSETYYCNQLIKGSLIPRNIKKAKKILESYIKDKDPGSYFLLYGKISMYEKKFDEGQDFYKKSISFDNNESMYKYGRFIIKDKRLIFNKVEGYSYIKKAIDKGYLKAMFKYGIILLKGDGISTINNEEKGMQYIKIAAEKGYKDALYYYYSIESKKR